MANAVVQILGVGISGFGFLLMYLAYKLIRSIIAIPNPPKTTISTINRYMLTCFVMTIAVGVFTFLSTEFKKTQLASLSNEVKNKDTALNILATAQRNDQLSDRIKATTNENTIVAETEKQKKVLDTLSSYFTKEKDSSAVKSFNNYRQLILEISDSLQMTNLEKPKMDSLKKRYARYNNSVNELSLKVANTKFEARDRMKY